MTNERWFDLLVNATIEMLVAHYVVVRETVDGTMTTDEAERHITHKLNCTKEEAVMLLKTALERGGSRLGFIEPIYKALEVPHVNADGVASFVSNVSDPVRNLPNH